VSHTSDQRPRVTSVRIKWSTWLIFGFVIIRCCWQTWHQAEVWAMAIGAGSLTGLRISLGRPLSTY
jgi:hypothetical protein